MYKFALIHYGTHEIYGLCFVASELERCGQYFRWFDGESENVVDEIVSWGPDFLCLSPLSAFFNSIIKLTGRIKERLPKVRSVFGGLHVFVVPEIIELKEVDIVVIGPVFGTIDAIINSKGSTVIKGNPIAPLDVKPSRRRYYEEIPRIGTKHVKIIMSHFGCLYDCAYCSNSSIRKEFGLENYKKHWLSRRSIENIIDEAKVFLEFPTKVLELADDDLLYGPDIEKWLSDFADMWKSKIGLPIFGNVTPLSVLRVSDKTLKILAELVTDVCMGLQAAEKETLTLFNRQYQTKEIFKKAIDRLNTFDIRAKIDVIVGNPVKDPVSDAISTINFAQSISSKNLIATIFPLMLYPGTRLTKWCMENNIPLNDECQFNFYSGIGSIKFDHHTSKRIRNLTKLGHFFISQKVPERWMRVLIEMDINNDLAYRIAQCNYYDSLRYHGESEEDIKKIMKEVKLYY